MVGEAGADAIQQVGGGGDQRIDGAALFGRGVIDRVQQRLQRFQQAAALLQHGGVADHAVGEFLAQFGNDLGSGLRCFRGGLHQPRDLGDGVARMRLGLRGNVLRGAGERVADCLLAAGGELAGLLPALAQCVGHRAECRAPGGQALLVAGFQRGLKIGVRLLHLADQRGGLLLEAGGGGVQRLLVARGERLVDRRLFGQRALPGIRGAGGGGFETGGDVLEQFRRTLFEGTGKLRQRAAQILHQCAIGFALLRQRLAPQIRDGAGGGGEAGRQAIQLLPHGLVEGAMQRGGFAGDGRHRGFHDRLQRGAGGARAFAHAFLQRGFHRGGEPRVHGFGALVEGILPGLQLFVGGAAVLFQRGHHRFQAIDQRRHRIGLPLQQPEGFLALVRLRMHAQSGGDGHVQRLHGLLAFAAAQCRQQAEHGRGGDAGDRCPEGETQPLDRRRQRFADRIQIGGAFQRHAGAAQRAHHAQQGAEHAEQDQQADQVGRKRRRRQRGAFALDAQAHRMAQGRMQACQPFTQVGRGRGQIGDRAGERGGGLPVAIQLESAGDVAGADQQGDGQGQRIGADIAQGDPADGNQAGEKDGGSEQVSEHVIQAVGCEGPRAGPPPVAGGHPVRRAAGSACPCGRLPATRPTRGERLHPVPVYRQK